MNWYEKINKEMERIQRFISANVIAYKRLSQISDPNERNDTFQKREILKKVYEKWISSLLQRLHNKQYRNVIADIEINSQKYNQLSQDIWKCRLIKAQCMLKLIGRKINKYPFEIKKENSKKRYSIFFWFNQVFLSLEQIVLIFRPELNQDIDLQKEETLDKIELVVQLHLDMLYHLCLFSMCIEEIAQMCTYFGMANNLKGFLDYSRHPRTMHLFQKLCLLRASVLIGNYDFTNSLKYQKSCMDICFRELFFLVDFDEGLNSENQKKKNKFQKRILNSNFQHLVLAFYLRGVCFEYFGKLSKAIESYKQSRYFSVKFLNEVEPDFTFFFRRLEKRAFIYHEILSNIKEGMEKIKKARVRRELRKIQMEGGFQNSLTNKKNDEILKKIANGEKMHDFGNLEKNLEKITFLDVQELSSPNDKEKPKTKFIMSTVKMINTLLSKDFVKIVKNLKTVEINNFDRDTLDIIKKKAKEVKQRKGNRITLSKSISSKQFSSKSDESSKSCSKNRSSITKSKSEKSCIPSLRYQPKVVEKLNFDEENFSKVYIKKKKILEKYNKREIEFLKKLLASKKNEIEKEKPSPIDPQKIQKDAENEFTIQFSIAKSRDNRTAIQKLIRRKSYKSLDKDYLHYTPKPYPATHAPPSQNNSFFPEKRSSYVDLANISNVSRVNNEMIKKLNNEYELLSSQSNMLRKNKKQYCSLNKKRHSSCIILPNK